MSTITISTSRRVDFAIVRIWYNLAKYLGLTPINRETKVKIFIANVYPFMLMSCYLGATMFSFYERFYIYQQFNISQTILDVLQGSFESLFVEQAIVWGLVRRNRWRRMLRLMEKVEKRVTWTVDDFSLNRLRFKVFFYHFFYATVHIYDSIANWKFLAYSLAFIIFRFTTYYIMFSTLFIAFVCSWTRNRYVYLDNFLKVPLDSFKVSTSFRNEAIHFGKLMEFKRFYKDLYLIGKEINAVFGCYFFFVAICSVLEILNAVNYGMPTKKQDKNDDIIGVNLVYLLLYVICNVQIVMSCDSIVKTTKNIWKTCLILHEQSDNPHLKKEFLLLSYFVQGLAPEFTAAGFWTVNQSVLSTLFSSVMTYLIIIIQFNMTLK